MDYLFRRPKPRSLGTPQPRRATTAAGARLSTIIEGAPSQPSATAHHRLSNMSAERRAHLGDPPEADAEKQPPSYKPFWSEASSRTHLPASVEALRWHGDRKDSRGGWKRVALIGLAVLLIVIALAVGLGVGLTQRNNKSATNNGASGDSAPTSVSSQPYPIGSWSITTALEATDTNCTSVSDTWSCIPYTTYSQNPAQSQTIYNWDIQARDPSSPSNNSLLISTTQTDLLLTFSNASLWLVDQGLQTERYTFTIVVPKVVFPAQTLVTDANVRTICYYNQTTLTGSLYTRMSQTYVNPNMPSTPSGANARKAWGTAAQIGFSSPGGTAVPDCYPSRNNAAGGPRISAGLTAQPASNMCSCSYMNYNLS